MSSSIDALTHLFDYQASVNWKPSDHFIDDINLIVSEINMYDSVINVDIMEILVSCGHNLTWNYQYFITSQDFSWFKMTGGKEFFFKNLKHKFKSEEYLAINYMYERLVELFELQLE